MKPHRSACSLSDFSYPAPCRVAYSIFFSLFLSVLVLGLLYMLDFCLQIPLCPAFLFSLPIPSSYFIEPLWRASHLHFLLESPTVLIPTIPSYSGPFFSGILSQSETIYRLGYWVFLSPQQTQPPQQRLRCVSTGCFFVMDIGHSQLRSS